MEKIIDYMLVSADYDYQLSKKVNELIVKGWQPQGGVSAMEWPNLSFSQAMVKYG